MLKSIQNSGFAKNVFVLFSGSLIAQLIPFFILPILQKYYFTPGDFGLLTLFVTFFELFSRVATLKLEFGIVLQNRTRDAINLAIAAIKTSFYVALISGVFVAVFHKELGEYYEVSNYSYYFLLLPIYILLSSFTDVANYWFNRKKNFRTIAYAKVVQTSFAESSKLVFGLLNFNFNGLLLGRLLGYITTSLYFLSKFLKSDKKWLRLVNKSDQKRMIQSNKKFIFFSTPSVFIGALINLSYLNLFQYYYGEDVVGNIGVSMLYLGTGFGVISLSFSQVFYSKLAEITQKSVMSTTYKRFSKNLFLVAILPVVGVFLIPQQFVVYLLGETWAELLPIAKIMVVWLAVWFISSSLSFIFIRLGKQREMVLFDLVHLALIFIGFFVGKYFYELPGALWGFSLSQALFYLITIFAATRFIKRSNLLD